MSAGPIALVGSGEFLPVMEEVDRALLDGRSQRVVFLPTAAAPEGRTRLEYWVELGTQHYQGMGVDVQALLVCDRADADDDAFVEAIAGAGLVYLSGGNPAYLTDTLRDTAVWREIHAAWTNGAALAGCSAGAIALSALVRDRLATDASPRPALGVVPDLAVLPHFDRLRRFRPEIVSSRSRGLPDGVTLVGVDEDTAIVGPSTGPWTVMGRQRAWVFPSDGEPVAYDPGSVIDLSAER